MALISIIFALLNNNLFSSIFFIFTLFIILIITYFEVFEMNPGLYIPDFLIGEENFNNLLKEGFIKIQPGILNGPIIKIKKLSTTWSLNDFITRLIPPFDNYSFILMFLLSIQTVLVILSILFDGSYLSFMIGDNFSIRMISLSFSYGIVHQWYIFLYITLIYPIFAIILMENSLNLNVLKSFLISDYVEEKNRLLDEMLKTKYNYTRNALIQKITYLEMKIKALNEIKPFPSMLMNSKIVIYLIIALIIASFTI